MKSFLGVTALIACLAAGPALAGLGSSNGIKNNGIGPNGFGNNGINLNGLGGTNGISLNGLGSTNGIRLNGMNTTNGTGRCGQESRTSAGGMRLLGVKLAPASKAGPAPVLYPIERR